MPRKPGQRNPSGKLVSRWSNMAHNKPASREIISSDNNTEIMDIDISDQGKLLLV